MTEDDVAENQEKPKAPAASVNDNDNSNNTNDKNDVVTLAGGCCTRTELTELVGVIKFAKPDASMRSVHREISQELSKKEGFEFLADIELNDVKKVWKKAVSSASQQQQTQQQHGTTNTNAIPPELVAGMDVLKLYTVGDANVRLLAQNYSQAAAAAEAAKCEESRHLLEQHYVHVFEGVPMDKSGSRPHQALINFNDNHAKKKQTADDENTESESDNNNNKSMDDSSRGEIVKIQVAFSTDDTLHPMLLYNSDRSLKTSIHPDPGDDGYQRIRTMIVKDGIGGALGNSGGTKAYFYARLTKPKKEQQGASKTIISVDVSGLAPVQTW
jgi:hypothetical protein